MTLDLINFVPNTKIKASEANTNFSLLNDELSITQGTVEQLNSTVATGCVPVGTIIWFAGSTAPDGYLVCDGEPYPKTAPYVTLYTVIGTTYGTDGDDKFRVPKLIDNRFIKGSATVGTAADAVIGTHNHTASVTSWGEHQHYYSYASGHPSGLGSVISASPGLIDGIAYTNAETFGVAEYQNGYGSHSHNITVDNAGSGDNAPKSLTLLPCIKY